MKRSLMCALFAVGAGCSGGGGDGLDTSNDERALGLLAPVAVDDELWTVEDLPITVSAADLVAYDLDGDGDALTVVSVANARSGTVALSASQNITFTPARDFVGDASFDYVVSDGSSTDVGTVTVHCQPSNDPPLAVDDRLNSPEDAVVTLTASALLSNDSDPDGDPLRITSVNSISLGKVRLAGDVVTFQPLPNVTGLGRFDYVVSDGQRTDTGRVYVNLTPVNDPPVAVEDSASTSEDVALVVSAATLLANDSDVDSKPLAVASVGDAVNGTVTLDGANVRFEPAPNFAGAASFTYAAFDGELTSSATVTVAVAAVNDPPVATADAFSTAAGAPLAIPVAVLLANDVDVEGSPLTLTAVGEPTHGTVSLSGGTATFTPAPGFEGAAGFTYTVSDGALLSVAQVSVLVFDGNDPPVAVDDVGTTAEDSPLAFAAAGLTGNDLDPDGDPLTVVAVSAATQGTVALSGGQVVFTPAPNFAGAGGFDYVVSDGEEVDVGHVTVQVTPVNDAPVAVADSAAVLEDGALALAAGDLVGNDSDVDGDALSVVAVQSAIHGAVTLGNGGVVFTPAANYHGPASFEYVVSDGTAVATGTVNVTVTPVADAPVAVADTATTAEDTTLTLAAAALLGNDTDVDEDPLSLVAVGNAVGGAVALTGGAVTFTPAPDHNGAASFDYTVSDGVLTASGVVTVTVTPVNDLPTADGFTATTVEDSPVSIDVSDLIARGDDVDGDALTVAAVDGAVDGTVVLAGGRALFTPAADFHGQASFDYQLTDGEGFAVATVVVTVTPANDAPVAAADTAATLEDTVLVLAAGDLLGNDRDVDNDALRVASVGNATGGEVRLDGDVVTFTPAPDHAGPASFAYVVTDGSATADAVVTIEVAPVNDAPVAGGDEATTAEDTAVDIDVAGLLANDRDIDSQLLAVTAVGDATDGTVALTGGTVTFTPLPNFAGTARFHYTVSDGELTGTGEVAVVVTPVNDAPVAAADELTVAEDGVGVYTTDDLLAGDRDVDGDALRVVAVDNAVNGTVSIDGTAITFTPDRDFHGAASFEYVVSDGALSDVGLVTVAVTPVNDAPVAVDDTATVFEDGELPLAAGDLLGNDSDIDGDVLTIVDVRDAQNGQARVSDGGVVFVPDANFHGTASFVYVVSDGGGTASALVTVTVLPVNDAPTPAPDSAQTSEDTAVQIAAAALLGNDSDIDGDPLSIIAVQTASTGTVTLAGGVVTFTPGANVNGAASFEYVVSDGSTSAVATVAVAIAPVNDAPAAFTDTLATLEDQPLVVATSAVTGNDVDVDGDALSVTLVRSPVSGTVALNGTTITFTPTANFNGTARFEYVVSDGELTAVGQANVVVAPVNDAPVAVDDARNGTEDSPVVIAIASLVANDTDLESNPLTITAVQAPVNGAVTITGSNVTFQPAPNFNGQARFDYVVSDGSATDVGTVVLTIFSANDAPVAGTDTFTTNEDVPLVVTVAQLLANDSDVDGNLLSILAVTSASNGTVVRSGNNVTFTPRANYAGPAGFDYLLSDGNTSVTGRVNITIAAVNDPPIPVPDALATAEDAAVTVAASNLTANDTDVDSALTLVAVQSPSNGTVSLAGGTVTFVPALNFNGIASFQYVVSDGTTQVAVLVQVTVTAVNDPPVVSALAAVTVAGIAVEVVLTAVDVDGDAVTFELASQPGHGTLLGIPPLLTYLPALGFTGTDTFSFRASDGLAVSAPATATITVNLGAAVCGNLRVEADEACDDGNRVTGDGCDANCSLTACGNGEVGGFAATALTLEWLGTSCQAAEIAFSVGDTVVHREALSSACGCDAGIGSATVDDPEVLALLGADTTMSVAITGADGALAWAVATVAIGEGGREVVLFDEGGGGDAELRAADLCVAGYAGTAAASAVTELVEECDDGNGEDGDGCSAACLVE